MTHREDIWRGPHERNTPKPSHAAKNEPHTSPETDHPSQQKPNFIIYGKKKNNVDEPALDDQLPSIKEVEWTALVITILYFSSIKKYVCDQIIIIIIIAFQV